MCRVIHGCGRQLVSMTENQEHDIPGLIRTEQVRLLFSAMPLSFLAIVINSSVLVVLQWDVIGHSVLLLWLLVLYVVMVLRAGLYFAYKRFYVKGVDNHRWLRYFGVGVILSGIIWGAATVWLFPQDAVGNQVLVAFVIAGMSAGATTSLSYERSFVLAFLTLTLIPLSIRFFLHGDSISTGMAVMSLLFFVMMSSVGMRNYRNFIENIRLRIEARIHESIIRESEEKYRHIFNSSPLAIVHYGLYGVITGFNNNFVELLETGAEDLMNLDLLNDTEDEDLQRAVSRSLSGEPSVYEGRVKSIAGRKETDVRIFFRGMHSDLNVINGGVAVLEDISEDVRVKKLKNDFISTISHELRTPLTAIRGAVGLLQAGAVGDLSESAREMLKITNANSELLLMLINDILDIDKIESGTMTCKMEPLDVMTFMDEVKEVLGTYALQHDIRLRISGKLDGIYTMADKKRLLQVMYNLMSNAVKFSAEYSEVNISVSEDDEDVVIAVRDQGEGIPEEFKPRVFERFAQADASNSRRTGGTGLGLSIAKGIVERHQGHIDFESGKQGTTFRIRLKKYIAAKGNSD